MADYIELLAAHDRLEAERDSWRNGLMSLTIGGSEFTEPNACVVFVRNSQERQHNTIVKFKLECDRLRAEVAELVGAVRDVRAWIILPFNAADEDSESLHPAFRKALKSVNAVLAKHQSPKEPQS